MHPLSVSTNPYVNTIFLVLDFKGCDLIDIECVIKLVSVLRAPPWSSGSVLAVKHQSSINLVSVMSPEL